MRRLKALDSDPSPISSSKDAVTIIDHDHTLDLPIALCKDSIHIPKTIIEVLSHPGWCAIMKEEIEALDTNDPQFLANDLYDVSFKGTWMLDLGIKCGEGEVWPRPYVVPDFTQSKVCSWWASLVKDFISDDVDGIWNDMNEPVVFKVTLIIYGMLMGRSTFEGMKLANENKHPFVLTRAGFIGS
ncbi:uncharacterized protein LOC131173818 [Hevea brasiliensis]|uniref:uncharacterized protein LOC131173818 n=1 Tax=Hevea brasiliensis TaxID=3981 RepID=UPI0025F7F6E1|nr:uncharacterized protein LOC131173818 [Hevea brasiliensis]